MRNNSGKKVSLPLVAFFVVTLFWACSFDTEVMDSESRLSELPQDSVISPVEEPADNPVDNPENNQVKDSVDNPVANPANDSQEVNEADVPIDSGKLEDPLPEPILDLKDTIYRHDTVVVYKDTVYDSLYETRTYKSFVYRKASGVLDTVYEKRVAFDCDIDEDGKMVCEEIGILAVSDLLCCNTYHSDSIPIHFVSARLLDTNRVYVHFQDTVYVDTLRLTKTVYVHDTIRYNYGENRLTDYIPPEYINVATYAPFDSVRIRGLLDTLDFGGDSEERAIYVQSNWEFVGLPANVYELVPLDTVGRDMASLFNKWPKDREVRTRKYYFDPSDELTSDTTVTWTLGYTHYENGIEETDTIQVTTFLKMGL